MKFDSADLFIRPEKTPVLDATVGGQPPILPPNGQPYGANGTGGAGELKETSVTFAHDILCPVTTVQAGRQNPFLSTTYQAIPGLHLG